jgi:hypothetical protein
MRNAALRFPYCCNDGNCPPDRSRRQDAARKRFRCLGGRGENREERRIRRDFCRSQANGLSATASRCRHPAGNGMGKEKAAGRARAARVWRWCRDNAGDRPPDRGRRQASAFAAVRRDGVGGDTRFSMSGGGGVRNKKAAVVRAALGFPFRSCNTPNRQPDFSRCQEQRRSPVGPTLATQAIDAGQATRRRQPDRW